MRSSVRCVGALVAGALAACDGGVTGPIESSGGMAEVSAGSEHTCGLVADGSVYCWGEGRWGQLGVSDDMARSTPTRIEWAVALSRISAGGMHTCGLAAAGDAYCWGVNTVGQVGNNTTITQSAPVPVESSVRFTSVASGLLHTCALSSEARVFCWGGNAQNQAGTSAAEFLMTPQPIEASAPFEVVTAGGFHSCALAPDGTAYCWGGNSLGQLGDGTTRNRTLPVRVSGEHRFSAISAGYLHTCGVTVAGALLCWGSSVHGELGTGGVALPGLPGSEVPKPVSSTASFTAVSAGHHVTCAVTSTREVWCWGRGGDGQLGNGSRWDQSVPQPVYDGDPTRALRVRQVSTGVTHVCAVSESNVTFCWGRGERGQLGARDRTQSSMAIRVREQPR
jgi:alpha-tubulin suppressor-like RCC1 family protein